MIKEKRKRKRRIKHVLRGILLFLIAAGIAALVVVKLFTVQKVVVKGNELYSDEQIKEWVLNDEYSWNTLYVFLKYRFMEAEDKPFIDTMEITMKPPHVINIEVYEKGMLGYLYIDAVGQNVYFDKDGFVVETSPDVIEDVPKITGLNCNEVVLYEKLKLQQNGVLKDLLNITNMLKKYGLVADEISYESTGDFKLHFGDIDIKVGETRGLEDKIVRIQNILPQLEGKKGVLHMENWTENNTDIVFKNKE